MSYATTLLTAAAIMQSCREYAACRGAEGRKAQFHRLVLIG
ncbi:hypothetical protein [Mesorhizobium sp. IMUNJ 23232]